MSGIERTKFEVAPTNDGWTVTRHGFGRDSTHTTKEAAVKRATTLARARKPSELLIRKQDGSVHETRHYGADPRRILKR